MRLWLILALAIVVMTCVPVATANVVINPNPAEITCKQNAESIFEATITNNFPFKLVDFEFTEIAGFTFPEVTLEENESKVISYKVNYAEAGSHQESTLVSFKYLVDLPIGTQTHYVNITQDGYSPDRLVVREGDTVIWTNDDTITRTVTSALFDSSLEPDAQFSWVFSEVGNFYYQDLILYYAGEVVTINASEEDKVNNPSYDIAWNFDLNVALDPTLLEINNNQDNYTVGATESKEGLLEITNIGEMKAQKVSLSADPDWIRFDENNFDLGRGEKNFVTYHIEPKIFETDATDRNYTIALRVEGTNVNQTTHLLHVYVPFSDVFDDIQTNEGFLEFYSRFCEENPTLFICDPSQTGGEGNQTIIVTDPTIPVNLTSREVLDMLKRIQRIEDSNARTNNELKALSVKYGADLPKILQLMNESVALAQENQDNQTSKERAFWWAVFFVILIICVLVIAFAVRRHYSRKSQMDGGYNFNN